ncbi:MAG: RhuM family protein, partial [Deferrisomatales bacterium]|nr:RhuM family protein [Deferrisomatales bacterium]
VIVRHVRNIYATGELDRATTCAKNAQVAADGKVRQMDLYNLDMAIAVGYRVNSKRGTQFRIWATRVLREHLVRGYTDNAHRLRELRQAVRLVVDVAERRDLSGDEAKAVLRVVSDYAYALDVLDDYDHQRVQLREVQLGAAAPRPGDRDVPF